MPCLISFVWASPSCQERERSDNFKWKCMSPSGIVPRTPRFQPGALDCLATGTNVMMRLKLLQNPDIWISTRSNIDMLDVHWIRVSDKNCISLLVIHLGSCGGVVVKFLVCGARGPGLDSRSRRYDFRDWLSPASKSRYGWKIAKAS